MKKITHKLPELSLIYPAYNEAGNIEEAIRQAQKVLPKIAKKFEIIVVNDGSKDLTLQIVKRIAEKDKNITVVNQRNKGYGGAIKSGFKKAKYEWLFFTDSDLQFDLEEIENFVPYHEDYQLILGFRKNRAEGKKRKLLADMLKIWNYTILGFPREIKDIDCAFKLFNQKVLKTIQPINSNGAMVSTEFLLKAHLAGFKYKQIGVTHYQRNIGNPTGSNLKVIFKAVIDTFSLKKQILTSDFISNLKEIKAKFRYNF